MSYLRSLPPQALLESPVEKTPVSVACGVLGYEIVRQRDLP